MVIVAYYWKFSLDDLIIFIEDFALLTDRSVRTVKNILWSGKRDSLPPARKIGRKTFFLRSDVEQWLVDQPIINKPPRHRGRPRKSGQGGKESA